MTRPAARIAALIAAAAALGASWAGWQYLYARPVAEATALFTKSSKETGAALTAMESYASQLPEGFSYEWTELALQEKSQGNTGPIVFLMAVVLVFLVLAAQYEAFTLPLAVILIVPMCILAAILGVNIRGFDNNILVQIGLIVLVGLAAKNAILIVEFARQREEQGEPPHQAAEDAARTRLRPILMTSFAFILGVLPLAIATGAGSGSQNAIGIGVMGGMIAATVLGVFFVPLLYVIVAGTVRRWRKAPAAKPAEATIEAH